MQTFQKFFPVSSKICITFPSSFFVKNQKTLFPITYLSKTILEHSLKIISDHNSTQCMKNINLIAIATHRNCYGCSKYKTKKIPGFFSCKFYVKTK